MIDLHFLPTNILNTRKGNKEAQLINQGDEILVSKSPRMFAEVKDVKSYFDYKLCTIFMKDGNVYPPFTKISLENNSEKYIEEFEDTTSVPISNKSIYSVKLDFNVNTVVINNKVVLLSNENVKIDLVKRSENLTLT